MITVEVEIINKLGLHARAAAKLVRLASSFNCHIELEKDGKKVNGKSIMGVMMLAASKGSKLKVITHGDDEKIANERLVALVNDRFEEGE